MESWLLRLLLASWGLVGLGSALASASDTNSVDEVGAHRLGGFLMPSLILGWLASSLSVTCLFSCSRWAFFLCLRRLFLAADVLILMG